MKILHFLTCLDLGGAQILRLEILKYLEEIGVENYLGYLKTGPMLERLAPLCKDFRAFGPTPFSSSWPLISFELLRYCKAHKIDLVHSALWSANFWAKLLARISNIPVIVDLHNKKDLLGKARQMFDLAALLANNHKTISVSRAIADSFNLKVDDQKNFVVTNGIDFSRFEFSKEKSIEFKSFLGLDPSVFFFGTIGRFEPEKNMIGLIELFGQFYSTLRVQDRLKVGLIIVGGGSQEQAMHAKVDSMSLSKVVKIFPRTNRPEDYLCVFDTFVNTSWSEGLPVSILEALASGLPVLASVDEPRLETLFLPPTLESFLEVYKTKEKKRVNRLDDYFDKKNMLKAYLRIYKKCLEEN